MINQLRRLKSRTVNGRLCCLAQERVEIEWVRGHRDGTVRVPRPLFFRTITIKLEAVVIRIVEIKRFTDAMVARAVERNLGGEQSAKCVPERCAIGIENCQVKQTGRARRRRRPAETFPRVQPDVMVISTCRNKRCLRPQRCISSNPSTPQ